MNVEDEVDDFFNKNIESTTNAPLTKKRKRTIKEEPKKKKIQKQKIEKEDLFSELKEEKEIFTEEEEKIEVKELIKKEKKTSGLDKLLDKMTEKSTSTIQKSKKDWETFKVISGTKSEVESFAKDG
jgi:hypothetical protein